MGDLDGDGVGDIAVGKRGEVKFFETGAAGALYVLLLHADGTVKGQQKFTPLRHFLDPGRYYTDVSYSLASINFNNDRVVDLTVGFPTTLDADRMRGAVYILKGELICLRSGEYSGFLC